MLKILLYVNFMTAPRKRMDRFFATLYMLIHRWVAPDRVNVYRINKHEGYLLQTDRASAFVVDTFGCCFSYCVHTGT